MMLRFDATHHVHRYDTEKLLLILQLPACEDECCENKYNLICV